MCDLALASVRVLTAGSALRGRAETDWRPEERQQGGEGVSLVDTGGREGGRQEVEFKGDILTKL